jgi:type II secretory pathway pseudopilin PulG
MLVVLLIVGLVLALALPRLGYIPAGLRIANSLGAIRAAFASATTIAAASGRPVRVQLVLDQHLLQVHRPAAAPTADGRPTGAGRIFDRLQFFALDDSVVLDTMVVEVPEDPAILTYRFYPNGEASGPEIPLRIADRPYVLDVDRLTGRPLIRASEER